MAMDNKPCVLLTVGEDSWLYCLVYVTCW